MAEQEKSGTSAPSSADGLPGWLLPVVGLVLAGGLAAAYLLGFVGDQLVAEVLAAGFVIVLAAIALKAGLGPAANPAMKGLSVAYVALFLFVALYPATKSLLPGQPAAEGTLSAQGDKLALPGAGTYRILVHTPLHEGSEARVSYTIKAGNSSVEGTLERTYAYRRARRGAAVRVSEDHDVDAHQVTVGDPAQVSLDSVRTDSRGGTASLTVRAYPLLPPVVMWLAMGLVVVAGAFLEAKLSVKGAMSMTGAAAISFAFLIDSANPGSALGPVMGSALLGAGGGALGGSFMGWAGHKLFPPAEPKGFAGTKAAKDRQSKAKEA